ncbi:MAG: TlpA disulfide reductase family protein [Pseudomonadota bacterium]
MRITACLLLSLCGTAALAAPPKLTEDAFRETMKIAPHVRMAYRDLQCKPVNFDGFAEAMHAPGAHADVDRSPDGAALTMTVRLRGNVSCPSPYPPITEMPPFALRDLSGKRVTSDSLRGKPTLISFFFSTCKPCILEVEPLNRFAASRPQMNFLAVTFDDAKETRQFVQRFGVKWRVVPDARDLIDRVRVKNYPTLALFDADGRLLGMKKGGASDALEAANVEPQVKRWVDSLLRR